MISDERINDFEEPDFTTSNEYAKLYNFCCQLIKERKQLVAIAEAAEYAMTPESTSIVPLVEALKAWRKGGGDG